MLSVREIRIEDIDLITEYWLNSSEEYLRGMGVDLDKMPARKEWRDFLRTVVEDPIEEKKSFCLIWELDGKAIGHCNVSKIAFGNKAYMHLHIWQAENRNSKLGVKFLQKSLPIFFERLQLLEIYCEPWAENPAPNKTLRKVGFALVSSYFGVPGWLNFEQKVHVYRISKTANDLV